MKKNTIKQQNLEFLQSRGWTVDTETRVSRYIVLSKSGIDDHYYLGNAGAVRRGRTVSGSISVKLNINPPAKRSAAQQPIYGANPAKIKQEYENNQAEGEQGSDPQTGNSGGGNSLSDSRTEEEPATVPFAQSQSAPTISPVNAKKSGGTPATVMRQDDICVNGTDFTQAASVSTPSSSPLSVLLRRSIEKVEADKAAGGPPHLEVQALAGTGKTTTVIEGIKELKGVRSGLTPSEQQAEVWKSMGLGRHDTVRVSAFSSKITEELKGRLVSSGLDKQGVEARGIHSLGLAAVTKRFGRVSAEKAKWVVADLAAELLGVNLKDVRGSKVADQIWAVDSLVSLCKQTLTEPTPDGLDQLASRYDIDLNGSREVYDLVPQVLEQCLQPRNNQITFDDMIYLPIKHNLPIYKVDLQVIDESQDLNRMQQELMYRSGYRIVFVGDVHQAIFGFAGADAESMKRMRQTLNGGEMPPAAKADPNWRGCITLPLTVTRRCGKAIVREAQKYVPEYQAHESNCEGAISHAKCLEFKGSSFGSDLSKHTDYRKLVQSGDFILCRCNAPLVSQCFKFIKDGRKAVILGKKVGEGLISLVDKSKARSVPDLISWLGDWLAREQANESAKKYPSEGRIEGLQDRHDCVMAFCEDAQEVQDVVRKINSIFTDNKGDRGITLSSIHKAKGLEARQIFWLRPPGAGPRTEKMQPWELEQERNLAYVAITRAIESLTYVS